MNLNQVTVPANDVNLSLEFYRKLGLKLIVYDEGSYARFECPEGGSTFSIHAVKGSLSGESPVVYFECQDIEAEVARLESLGLVIDEKLKEQPWLWREAYLRDPYGNRICLYYAGDNRLNPPWRIEQE